MNTRFNAGGLLFCIPHVFLARDMISTYHFDVLHLVQIVSDYLNKWTAWLAGLTLGEVWESINYHPCPAWVNHLALVVAAVQLAYKFSIWYSTYRQSRRVYTFSWPAPKVSSGCLACSRRPQLRTS